MQLLSGRENLNRDHKLLFQFLNITENFRPWTDLVCNAVFIHFESYPKPSAHTATALKMRVCDAGTQRGMQENNRIFFQNLTHESSFLTHPPTQQPEEYFSDISTEIIFLSVLLELRK